MNKQEQLSYLKDLREHNNSAGFEWVLDILIQHNMYGSANYTLTTTLESVAFSNGIVNIYMAVDPATKLITTFTVTNVFVDERYAWSHDNPEFPTVSDLWDYLD